MKPKQYQNETNANNPLNILYQNHGIENKEPEPRYQNRRNRGFSTETGTELKNQDHTNTNLFVRKQLGELIVSV